MPRIQTKIWRKNFEVKRAGFLLAYEALANFYWAQKHYFGKYHMTHAIWVGENLDNLGTYFLKDELRKVVDLTFDQVINRPERIRKIHQKTIIDNRQYFKILSQTKKLILKKLSNRQLADLYKKHYRLIRQTHGYSIYSTWFVDSDGEDLTNYLLNYVKNLIAQKKLDLSFAAVFSLLTTPTAESFAQVENRESLRVLKLIKNNLMAKHLFLTKPVDKIEIELNQLNPAIVRKMLAHYRKWCWTPYTYLGPAYDLDYYLTIWSGLLKQKIDPDKAIARSLRESENVKQAKNKLLKKIGPDRKHRQIFDLASQIIWLKAYRKDVLFHACYFVEKIYKEIAKRFGLSLNQVRSLTNQEVQTILLKNKFDANELNQRVKFFVINFNNSKTEILTGKKAKVFLARQNFEAITIQDVKELSGTPACPGKVKGKVRIIDLPEEMVKMSKGDVMVSHTTFPALVPAMKKASAIVTDDGGLTCHAAIVARELKTPCVVGVKIATRVLKDGDLVEVDADNGVVRKL